MPIFSVNWLAILIQNLYKYLRKYIYLLLTSKVFKEMTATNINLNELANEIYLENAIAYKGITKEEFTNYFINKMEGVTLSTTMVVHAVAFCTREYEQVRKEIELLKNN